MDKLDKSSGFISDFPDYYLAFVEKKELEDYGIKSYCGVIYTDPTIYELYSYQFLSDEDLKHLLNIYSRILFSVERREEIVKALDIFFETGNKKPLLQLVEKFRKLPVVGFRGHYNDGKTSQSKPFMLYKAVKVNSDAEFTLRFITVPVEGSDYIFSEGIKFKALTETVRELSKVLPYMEEFLKLLDDLKTWFEGERLNLLTDIASKLLILNPIFAGFDGKRSEVVYSLKLVNLNASKKAGKMLEKFPQMLENRNIKGAKIEIEEAYKDLKRFYQKGDYIGVIYRYLVYKLLASWQEIRQMKNEIFPNVKKLVLLYAKQLNDRKEVTEWLKKTSQGFNRGEKLYGCSTLVRENVGRLTVIWQLPPYNLRRYLKFASVKFDKVFPFQIESLGQMVDAFLTVWVLSKFNNSLILSLNYNGLDKLKYRRLKSILNIVIRNQTITERGYKSLKYGMDNVLRSLQKSVREGIIQFDREVELFDYVLIESFVSNRIKEVLREEFESLNELTAHRVFKIVRVEKDNGKINLKTLGSITALAGDFLTTEIVYDFDRSEIGEGGKWLALVQTDLKKKNISKLLSRLNIDYGDLKLVNLEEVNIILNAKPQDNEGFCYKEDNGIVFIKPLPKVLQRGAYNEKAIYYKGDNDDRVLNTLTALHLIYSDSRYFPFSSIKLFNQRLGKLNLRNGKVYYSIALLELYGRLLKVGKEDIASFDDFLDELF